MEVYQHARASYFLFNAYVRVFYAANASVLNSLVQHFTFRPIMYRPSARCMIVRAPLQHVLKLGRELPIGLRQAILLRIEHRARLLDVCEPRRRTLIRILALRIAGPCCLNLGIPRCECKARSKT